MSMGSEARLLLLDVDGVLTDGRITYGSGNIELKSFDVKDGHGIKLVQRAGIEVGIITGRESEVVARRASELGIVHLYQGAKDKLIPYREILQKTGLCDEAIAYVGDDLIDLPILQRVGFSATVSDAVDEVKERVDFVASRAGGHGAVREICDILLRSQGLWDEVTSRYFKP
mgnify:CR=1 FL=1